MDGTRRRIAAAQRWAPPFGVATECGLGRRAPESVPALLGLHRAAADYLATTLGCHSAELPRGGEAFALLVPARRASRPAAACSTAARPCRSGRAARGPG
jgi:hypothetical protein